MIAADLSQLSTQEIVEQLTLEQKIGQMTLVDRSTCSPQDAAEFFVGGVMSAAGSCPTGNQRADWVSTLDQYWNARTQKSGDAHAIPILYGLDAIHGNANVNGATIFPHNIGLGAANSIDDYQTVARITADEVRAIGANWIFGPNLAIAQHYHWGRTYESLSPSSDKVSQFSSAYITALNASAEEYPILGCAKHWVGDGGTEHGIEQGDTRQSRTQLDQHIKPFKAAIDAGVMSVMVAFSSWNGDKCHANEFLISQVLKKDMKFEGFVLSDMHGINYVDEDFYKAIGKSVNAGIDMFMVPQNWRLFQQHLHKHVEMGTVSIGRINDAVTRIIRAKKYAGLFWLPKPSERCRPYIDAFGGEEHRQAARDIAERSTVLIKNSSDVLPLKKESTLLITGKSAHHTGNQCGGFTINWQGVSEPDAIKHATSIYQGLKQCFSKVDYVDVSSVKECKLDGYDAAIVVIGERPYAEGIGDIRLSDRVLFEASSKTDGSVNFQPPYGRSLALNELHPEDLSTITALKSAGLKVITVLLNGRPLIIDSEVEASDAFMIGWLPGSEGNFVNRLISGDIDFTGRLGFPWPTQDKLTTKELPLINIKMPYRQIWPIGYGFDIKNALQPISASQKRSFSLRYFGQQ